MVAPSTTGIVGHGAWRGSTSRWWHRVSREIGGECARDRATGGLVARRRGIPGARRGASWCVAAESLARGGVLSSPRLFQFYASVQGRDRKIRAGTYLLPRGE